MNAFLKTFFVTERPFILFIPVPMTPLSNFLPISLNFLHYMYRSDLTPIKEKDMPTRPRLSFRLVFRGMDTSADLSSAVIKRKSSISTAENLKRKKTGEEEPIGFELELDGYVVCWTKIRARSLKYITLRLILSSNY